MEVVHVLGDNVHVKHSLQPGQSTVSFVGLGRDDFATSLVVELQHQARVGFEALRRSHLLHPVAFPKSVCAAECRNARFRAHACAGEDHELGFRFVMAEIYVPIQDPGRRILGPMSERQFIVYDLEATCWRSRKPRKVEIIEIGAVKMNERLEVVDDFCQFVRPKLHPEISPFCTKLTSIVQDDIEDAPLFNEAIEVFEDWVGFDRTRSMLMSWGEFDRRQFMNDARLHNMELPWLKYWACLQRHYSRWKGSKNQIGLKNALEMEGLSFDGTQHRAIEDARNMGRLFAKVAKPLSIV